MFKKERNEKLQRDQGKGGKEHKKKCKREKNIANKERKERGKLTYLQVHLNNLMMSSRYL